MSLLCSIRELTMSYGKAHAFRRVGPRTEKSTLMACTRAGCDAIGYDLHE